ncbi:hypothetical protein [Nostoc sp. GT001]|jgi:hypothetical protein|uniref:hypothetical protein n=1 Tax=Nostoc sp. GT001 TaxID=3056647 RepID=UPI0025AA5A80|nr:hypothetical protein [Nostoc sp. GT001]MDM9580531.1 hypothetical protein [Nostoc sp. GT001]
MLFEQRYNSVFCRISRCFSSVDGYCDRFRSFSARGLVTEILGGVVVGDISGLALQVSG